MYTVLWGETIQRQCTLCYKGNSPKAMPMLNHLQPHSKHRPAYPKILLSVLRTAYDCIFRFVTRVFFADAPPISQNETVCELTFSIIQTNYARTTLFCSHLRRSFSIKDHRTHFSKNNALCVLLLLMLMRPFLNICCLVRVCFLGFVHSSFSSSVLCSHLSPTASNLPYRKMAIFCKVLM